MKVVFFGTPKFAVPILAGLVRSDNEVCAVVTQPSRPHGRKHRITPPPVAIEAKKLGLPILQPAKTSTPEFLNSLRAMAPDVMAVAAYRNMLGDELLSIAPLGGWNVHPSLLPRWRGPAPVHRTIWAGDETAGVSIMRMVHRMDAGPLAMREAVPVVPGENRGSLEARLAESGARALVETLKHVEAGTVQLKDQNDEEATYAPVFGNEDRVIDWGRPATELSRIVRALAPHPAAYFMFSETRVKTFNAEPVAGHADSEKPGELVERRNDGAWIVTCGTGAVAISHVQPAGKAKMPMDSFVAGRRLKPGDSLK